MNPRTTLALASLLLSACGSLETARTLDLRDVPLEASVRRPEGRPPGPLFVDRTYWLKRGVNVELSVEPDLETHVRAAIEAELGVAPELVRIDYVGYRYAYYFPSRHDDFVIRAEVRVAQHGIDGPYEGVVSGLDLFQPHKAFGANWPEVVPYTGPPGGEDELGIEASLQRWADRRAFLNRLAILRAARHLARAVRSASLRH